MKLLDRLYYTNTTKESTGISRKSAYRELKELLTILKQCTTTKHCNCQDENGQDFDYCEINGKRVHWNDFAIVDEFLREK